MTGGRRWAAWAMIAATTMGVTGCGLLTRQPSQTVTVTATAAPTSTPDDTPTGDGSDTVDPDSDDSPTADVSGEPTAPVEGLASVKEGIAEAVEEGSVQEVDEFRTDEVYCKLVEDDGGGGIVGCELLDGAQVTSDVCAGNDAGVTGVGRIELDGATPTATCNSDSMLPSNLPAVEEGLIGQAIRFDGAGISCLSQADGVACVTSDGRSGWHIDTLSYEIWPSGPSASMSPTGGH